MNLVVNIKYSGSQETEKHCIWYDEYKKKEQFLEIFNKFNEKISKGGLVLFEINNLSRLIINIDKVDYITVG